MKTTDFTHYKFRCSSLGKIMVKSRSAKDPLSQTTKTYLKKLHKEEVFDKKSVIQSKYIDKGIQVEEKALTLYSEYTGNFFIKNKVRKSNDFITGEPDNVQGMIRDIKSSWSLDTFPIYDDEIPNKDYYWQLQGYMSLFDFQTSELIYCLVDTPNHLIYKEVMNTCWKLGYNDPSTMPQEISDEIENNLTFKNIPKQLKCKIFKLDRNDEEIRNLHHKIKICRNYLNFLSAKMSSYIVEPEKLLAV